MEPVGHRADVEAEFFGEKLVRLRRRMRIVGEGELERFLLLLANYRTLKDVIVIRS